MARSSASYVVWSVAAAVACVTGSIARAQTEPRATSKPAIQPVELVKPAEKAKEADAAPNLEISVIPITDPAAAKEINQLMLFVRNHMTDEERSHYTKAANAFELGEPRDAKPLLAEFLKAYPKSAKAAETLYRLAALELAAGKDASSHFERLLRDHSESTWTKLVQHAHYDDDKLLAAANKLRTEMFTVKETEQLAAAARNAYIVHFHRFASKNKDHAKETLYKIVDCYLALGQTEAAKEANDTLTALKDDDNTWVKLARLRLAPANRIAATLDDLGRFEGASKEAARLFVTLYQKHHQALAGDAAAQAYFHYGLSLCRLEHDDKGQAVFRALVEANPNSPWAGEAVFELGEHAYANKKPADAQAFYRHLLNVQPNHARAPQAAAWAKAIDRQNESVRQLETSLMLTFAPWLANNLQFSARVACRTSEKQKFLVELAYRDCDHVRGEITVGDIGLMLVSNPKGTWVWDRLGPVRVSRESIKLPMPEFSLSVDKAARTASMSFAVNSDSGNKSPKFSIEAPQDLANLAATVLAEQYHITCDPLPGAPAKTRILLEEAQVRSQFPTQYEVILDGAERIESIRIFSRDPSEKGREIVIDRLSFGSPIPDDRFAPLTPPGVASVPSGAVNHVAFIAQYWQIASEILEVAAPKKGR